MTFPTTFTSNILILLVPTIKLLDSIALLTDLSAFSLTVTLPNRIIYHTLCSQKLRWLVKIETEEVWALKTRKVLKVKIEKKSLKVKGRDVRLKFSTGLSHFSGVAVNYLYPFKGSWCPPKHEVSQTTGRGCTSVLPLWFFYFNCFLKTRICERSWCLAVLGRGRRI